MAGRQFAYFTPEATYGVYPASPTPPTGQIAIDLTADNAMSVVDAPEFYMINSAGGSNRTAVIGSQFYGVSGSITTPLWASQAKVLMTAACNLAAGPPVDLGSFSIDYGEYEDPGVTLVQSRYTGNKFGNVTIKCNSASPVMMFSGTVIGRTYIGSGFSPAFPVSPTWTAQTGTSPPPLPSSVDPYTFQGTSSASPAAVITWGGSQLTGYNDITIDIANNMVVRRDETSTIRRCSFGGRKVTITIKRIFESLQDRTDFRAVTAHLLSIQFTDGTNVGTLQCANANYITQDPKARPMNGMYEDTITIQTLLDTTSGDANIGTDIVYSQTP